MPSLADVPREYMDPDRQLDFVYWLGRLPIDEPTARQFMRLWSSAMGKPFTADHWNYIARQFRR